MARIAAVSPSPIADINSVNLSRILSRLERTVLSAESDPQLRKSSFERAKVGANLEHARLLLLRLEHDSGAVPGQSRKQNIQTDLQAKRDLIKQLNQRLQELSQLDDSSEDEGSTPSSDEDDDDILTPSYAPARNDATTSIDREQDQEEMAVQQAAANLTSTLRSRRAPPTSDGPTGSATGSSLLPTATTRANVDEGVARSETLLSHNRFEQENLTSSLLSMAQALKNQSVQFGTSLESEKSVLFRATDGLDKNALGMEAAGRRMGTLRRMTEGKNWWGRILMYAFIGGLWVVLILIWSLVPKLR